MIKVFPGEGAGQVSCCWLLLVLLPLFYFSSLSIHSFQKYNVTFAVRAVFAFEKLFKLLPHLVVLLLLFLFHKTE